MNGGEYMDEFWSYISTLIGLEGKEEKLEQAATILLIVFGGTLGFILYVLYHLYFGDGLV